MKKYYVQYRVQGKNGVFTAGPYDEHEALSQMDDIQGYEYIYDVSLVQRDE